MPNYHLDHYIVLGLDDDATYQDVIDRHGELIKHKQDNPSTDISIEQINSAKDRLTKLLRPLSSEELILVFDLDLTITKNTSINPIYLNNCDDAAILSNIRNPDEFKKLVLTAIDKGHRIAIATFNEYGVTYQNRKIYLARRILLALFNEQIVSQIWVVAKNNNSEKDKVFHINQIKKTYKANLSQMILIDDDIQVLKIIKNKFNNKLLTLEMTHYEENGDFKHLSLIYLLTLVINDKSILKKISQLINTSDRYLEICNIKTNNEVKIFGLLKKYILQNFYFIHPRIMIIGLMSLIAKHLTSVISKLMEHERMKFALCTDDSVLSLIDFIINNKAISNAVTDHLNKATLIKSIINLRNQYIANNVLKNIIIIPSDKIIQLIIQLQSHELAETYFALLPLENFINLFGILLEQCHWHLATILLRIHPGIAQKFINKESNISHLQNMYYRFPGKIKPISDDQKIIGKQLLLILRSRFNQHDAIQTDIVWLPYFALEITYGDLENLSNALNFIKILPNTYLIKNHIFICLLNRTLIPTSCEKNIALLQPWLEAILNNGIDLKIDSNNMESIMTNILLLNDNNIFDLLNKHFVFPDINLSLIKYCINKHLYVIALHLYQLLDMRYMTEKDIFNLNEIQELSIHFIEAIYKIAKIKGIPVPTLNYQQILLIAIEKGNISRVKDILKRNTVLINEKIIFCAIDYMNHEIIELLVRSASSQIDYCKILIHICRLDSNTYFNSSQSFSKSTRFDLLRTVFLHGHITDFNIKDDSGKPLLHLLIENHDSDSIELLLRYGFNPLITDADNRSALTFSQQIYNATELDDDEDNLEEAEIEDYYTHEIAEHNNTQIAQQSNSYRENGISSLDYREKITALLAKTEITFQSYHVKPQLESQLYQLVQCNQLDNTLHFLSTHPILKKMLSDKNNPIGLDLLSIILFKTQNSLLLKTLLSAGIAIQISESPINRIMAQLINQALCSLDSIKYIHFELLNILCDELYKNTTAKNILSDLPLLRIFIQLASQDSHALGSGFNLIDKFIASVGNELLYQPLLTENITTEQHEYLLKIRDLYPQNDDQNSSFSKSNETNTIATNSAEIIPTLPITTRTTINIAVREISESEKISSFSSIYTKGVLLTSDKKRTYSYREETENSNTAPQHVFELINK